MIAKKSQSNLDYDRKEIRKEKSYNTQESLGNYLCKCKNHKVTLRMIENEIIKLNVL